MIHNMSTIGDYLEGESIRPSDFNIVPYKILDWNYISDLQRFTKEDFLYSNPNLSDIEKWNCDDRNEKIIIS